MLRLARREVFKVVENQLFCEQQSYICKNERYIYTHIRCTFYILNKCDILNKHTNVTYIYSLYLYHICTNNISWMLKLTRRVIPRGVLLRRNQPSSIDLILKRQHYLHSRANAKLTYTIRHFDNITRDSRGTCVEKKSQNKYACRQLWRYTCIVND